MNEKMLAELTKVRKELRKKLRSIKMGEVDTTNLLEETFKPITIPLKRFINEGEEQKFVSKKRKKELTFENDNDDSYIFNKLPMKIESSTPNKSEIDENDFKKSGMENEDSDNNTFFSQSDFSENKDDSLNDLSALTRKNKLDTLYGPHKDKKSGEWMFGDATLKLSEDKISVGNNNWARTPGLFDLMFNSKPKNFDKIELKIYKKILETTNAYRRDYKADGQIKGTKAYKYKNIIRTLIKDKIPNTLLNVSTSNHKGSGMMKLNENKVNYIYWDDPNELVDRLRLLIASQAAGHTNHNNEIISIIEELREAKIIK